MIGSIIKHPVARFVIKAGTSAMVYEGGKRIGADLKQRMSGMPSKIFTPTDEMRFKDRREPTYKKK